MRTPAQWQGAMIEAVSAAHSGNPLRLEALAILLAYSEELQQRLEAQAQAQEARRPEEAP